MFNYDFFLQEMVALSLLGEAFKPFSSAIWEGIWWSFVSMTTVGSENFLILFLRSGRKYQDYISVSFTNIPKLSNVQS